jgi:hypothetical protein
MPLEGNAGERVAGVVAFRIYGDDQARIGVELCAGILAHAVCDDAPFLRSRGDDPAAGAHAEAIDGAPVRGVVRQAVGGGA